MRNSVTLFSLTWGKHQNFASVRGMDLTSARKCVDYEFGKILKTACIPASIQLRVTKGCVRVALFSGSVASGSASVVRDFEDEAI